MGVDSVLTGIPEGQNWEFIKAGRATATGIANDINVTTVPHNLGFVPVVFGSLDNGDISIPLPTNGAASITPGTSVNFQEWIAISADDTNVYIQIDRALAGTSSYPIKYYLFRVRARS